MNVQSEISCKRKAILSSAMELIREHGFQGAPMSLIARHAGVACGTIYHYFSGKDDVIREIFRQVHLDLADEVFGARDLSISFKDQFFLECKKLYTYYLEHPNVLHFIELYKNSPYFKETQEEQNQFIANFVAFFDSGKAEGQTKKIESILFAPVVFGSVSSMAKVHMAGRHFYSDQDFNDIISLVWDGIKAQ